MKVQNKAVFLIMAIFVTALILNIPQALAENVSVSTTQESSTETEMNTTETPIYTEVKITLDHNITGGKITNIFSDTDAQSLIIELVTTNQGELTVTLPRDIIDATINDEDDDFFVLIDGDEVIFEETKTSTGRTLTIQFTSGAEEIEIIGTSVVPEFGTIAAMVLAVAIISIIAISAKSRLGIMTRL